MAESTLTKGAKGAKGAKGEKGVAGCPLIIDFLPTRPSLVFNPLFMIRRPPVLGLVFIQSPVSVRWDSFC